MATASARAPSAAPLKASLPVGNPCGRRQPAPRASAGRVAPTLLDSGELDGACRIREVGEGVPCVGVDSGQCDFAGRLVVDMAARTEPGPVPFRAPRQQPSWSHLADHPHDLTAKLDTLGDRALRKPQKPDIVDTEDAGGGLLFGASDPRDVLARHRGVETTSVSVGQNQIGHRDPGRRPASYGATRPEVSVVGMRNNNQCTLDDALRQNVPRPHLPSGVRVQLQG